MKAAENQISYNNQIMEANGNVLVFDGEGNKQKKQLKIYRVYGSVEELDEAIQNFALDNGYESVILN
jgi:hypothetical protein